MNAFPNFATIPSTDDLPDSPPEVIDVTEKTLGDRDAVARIRAYVDSLNSERAREAA